MCMLKYILSVLFRNFGYKSYFFVVLNSNTSLQFSIRALTENIIHYRELLKKLLLFINRKLFKN